MVSTCDDDSVVNDHVPLDAAKQVRSFWAGKSRPLTCKAKDDGEGKLERNV